MLEAGGRHDIPPPPASWQHLVFIRQVAELFRHVGYLRHQQQDDLWPFDTWATSVPILVFLGLSVLRSMYATVVRQTDVRQKHRLMPPLYGCGGIIISTNIQISVFVCEWVTDVVNFLVCYRYTPIIMWYIFWVVIMPLYINRSHRLHAEKILIDARFESKNR